MDDVRLTHIGGPTVLIEVDGWRILTDPTFDGPGRRYSFGWGSSSRKLTGPAVDADELGPVDAVLLTHHHHADNLDDSGRKMLPRAGVVVTTTSGAKSLGGNALGLAPWSSTRLDAPDRPAIEVTATPCRHGPPLSHLIVGDVVGFALRRGDDRVLWVSGDTVLYGGVREVGRRMDVDIALLHVGGVRFPVTGPLRYTMTGREAVELCQTIRPRVAIPVHYEGWSHFREERGALERELATAPPPTRDAFQWLPIGTAVSIAPDATREGRPATDGGT